MSIYLKRACASPGCCIHVSSPATTGPICSGTTSLSVPADKIFTFGGDYTAVELIHGHAWLARRGVAQALSELVSEGWIAHEQTPARIERIMRDNAVRFFPNQQRAFAVHTNRAGTDTTSRHGQINGDGMRTEDCQHCP